MDETKNLLSRTVPPFKSLWKPAFFAIESPETNLNGVFVSFVNCHSRLSILAKYIMTIIRLIIGLPDFVTHGI